MNITIAHDIESGDKNFSALQLFANCVEQSPLSSRITRAAAFLNELKINDPEFCQIWIEGGDFDEGALGDIFFLPLVRGLPNTSHFVNTRLADFKNALATVSNGSFQFKPDGQVIPNRKRPLEEEEETLVRVAKLKVERVDLETKAEEIQAASNIRIKERIASSKIAIEFRDWEDTMRRCVARVTKNLQMKEEKDRGAEAAITSSYNKLKLGIQMLETMGYTPEEHAIHLAEIKAFHSRELNELFT